MTEGNKKWIKDRLLKLFSEFINDLQEQINEEIDDFVDELAEYCESDGDVEL